MIPRFKQINGFNVINNLKTNLNCNYYANQLNYKKIGNLVFCYLAINTQSYFYKTEMFIRLLFWKY